jgi:hypothetical protein
VNSKGFKKPRGCGVIQGDGINITTLGKIMDAVIEAGYSAEVRSCEVQEVVSVKSVDRIRNQCNVEHLSWSLSLMFRTKDNCSCQAE